MKEYVIKKIENSLDRNMGNKLFIDTFKWMDNNYKPETFAQILYDDNNIYVQMTSFENKIRAVHKTLNSPVCEDSCMEFFFRPENDKRYFNFEINAIGTPLIGLGEGRNNREAIVPQDISIFDIKTTVESADTYNDNAWSIKYKIPFSFLKEYYRDFSTNNILYANLFKCGDKSQYMHYGMWSEVISDEPDYHLPEYFGKMYFE